MTKLEKDIIHSINNKCPCNEVGYKHGGFFLFRKGIYQNFAVLVDDILFIRMDNSAYNISKYVFKNISKIDKNYKICIGANNISNMMTSRGYNEDDIMIDMLRLFEFYDKRFMIIFRENNISFMDLIIDTVSYFGVFDIFVDMVAGSGSKRFWRSIQNRYWSGSGYSIELSEFDQSTWESALQEKKRENLINDIISG